MRKKTIKFYFSNHPTNYLFCFSNRGFRQNKLLTKYKNKKHHFSKITKNYKDLVRRKINLNQWAINRNKLTSYFYKSFFSSLVFFRNSIKYRRKTLLQLKLFYFFKKRLNRFLIKFIKHYIKLGVLSSQVAHILARKNLSYQVWSKYRSKLFNMNFFSEWLYNSIKVNTTYSYILLNSIYAFSSDPRERSIHYDSNFNINTTTSIMNLYTRVSFLKNFLTSKCSAFIGIGRISINFSHHDIHLLLSNNDLIEKFLTESDTIKRDELKQLLDIKMNAQSSIVFSRFFIFFENCTAPALNIFNLSYFIKFYLALYKW